MNRTLPIILSLLLLLSFGLANAQTTMTFQGGVTMTVNSGTSMNVLGNVVFQPTSQVDNSGSIYLTGDWTNNSGSTALINSSPGLVEFYGDTQRISGSDLTRFYDLTLSGTGVKMLEMHAEAEGTLDLTDRELRTDTFDMHVSNTAVASISRTTGYVSSMGNGRLRRNTASTGTYLFPVGDPSSGGTYRPIELDPSSSAANTFDVRFVLDDPTNAGYNRANRDSSFCTVNDGFFHFIEQSAGSSSTDITMYFDSAVDGSFTQIGGWLNVPQWQNTSTATSGQAGGLEYLSISSWSDFSYGVFGLGKGVEKPTLVASGPLTFCAPGSLVVTTSIGYDTIVWSTGSTADTISVNSTTDIYAWVADQNGCSAYSDTISVNVQPLPSAGFNSSVAGFTATFTNISTNGTTYTWDFGDGNGSNASNPSHTYGANGTYTVCLIASNTCGNDTTCKSVVVNCPVPNTAFNYTTNNLAVTFNDNSTGGATSYTWDFGDGNSGSGANTNHTYGTPGTYTVCLITQNGCGYDTACNQVVVTCPAPNSSYTYAANNLSVNFTNGSTGGATSYTWDFGDGNGSSSMSPNHNYSSPGTYTVCLISSSLCGNDTSCQTISVFCPLPSSGFGYNASNLSVSFTNSTTGANGYSWDFGDGNVGSGATPTHNYSAPGTYTVCMIASNNCGSDTLCQSVNVVCPTPNGSFGYTSNNLSISFNNSTTGAQSYTWDFGDGNTGSGATPSHNYSTPGTYTVCMIAGNNCGFDTVCQNINVICPTPSSGFGYNATGLSVSMTNNSNGANSYSWDFGDGSSSSMPNPTHTFTSPGTYTVCLIATNSCGNDTVCQSVTVTCTLPASAYTYSTNNQTVNFNDQSSNNPTSWLWTFGDGNSSTLQNVSYTFANPGTYNVCLITTNSCGSDTICQSVNVTCPMPSSGFSFSPANLTVNFSDQSSAGVTNWYWDFGDGNSSTLQNPSHSYGAQGNYTVCLISSNACGADTTCKTITVTCVSPVAGFTQSVNGWTISFSDISAYNPTSWHWDFGDGGTSNQTNPVHVYQSLGTYQICLVVDNDCGTDTTCRYIDIKPTGIGDLDEQVNMEVFPNPSSDKVQINVSSSDEDIREITLMDAVGQHVRAYRAAQGSKSEELRWDVNDLAAGVYLIQVQFENSVMTKRFIVTD